MYTVYILYSHRLDTYYIGVTTDVQGRLRRHLSSRKGFTSRAKDWIVMYTESYKEKNQAYAREKEIKKWKSRRVIQHLISSTASEHPD